VVLFARLLAFAPPPPLSLIQRGECLLVIWLCCQTNTSEQTTSEGQAHATRRLACFVLSNRHKQSTDVRGAKLTKLAGPIMSRCCAKASTCKLHVHGLEIRMHNAKTHSMLANIRILPPARYAAVRYSTSQACLLCAVKQTQTINQHARGKTHTTRRPNHLTLLCQGFNLLSFTCTDWKFECTTQNRTAYLHA
jgi:hypothetical protein